MMDLATALMSYPNFDPVLVKIGPVAIHWYAIAYIAGFLAGWRWVIAMNDGPSPVATRVQIDDMLTFCILGVLLGGRIGYVLFYNLDSYLAEPGDIIKIWQGGMSFHGGFLGLVAGGSYVVRKYQLDFWRMADQIATVAPIGLFFGRIANFVNQELWGREAPVDLPWAVIFPSDPRQMPRHPSQLYEAVLEGLLLGLLLLFARRFLGWHGQRGRLTGLFIFGYGLARSLVELYRQPDEQVGYLLLGTTMGQWLSLPMVLIGLLFLLKPPGEWRRSAP